jgi:hypothetical protein
LPFAVLSRDHPLAFDEAYYWQWSKNLAWGYYDHPPLIAFMIRAGTSSLFSAIRVSAVAVRAALLLDRRGRVAVWRGLDLLR